MASAPLGRTPPGAGSAQRAARPRRRCGPVRDTVGDWCDAADGAAVVAAAESGTYAP